MNISATLAWIFFHATVVYYRRLYIGRFHARLNAMPRVRITRIGKPTKNDESLWKRALWVVSWGVRDGWEHAGDVARERESHLSAFLRRHCAPVYIDTVRDREKGTDKGRLEKREERVRKREKENISLYCRIGILPRIHQRVLFFFIFFIFAARHENGCTTLRCVSDTHRRRLAASPLCTPRISPVSMRRPVTILLMPS